MEVKSYAEKNCLTLLYGLSFFQEPLILHCVSKGCALFSVLLCGMLKIILHEAIQVRQSAVFNNFIWEQDFYTRSI